MSESDGAGQGDSDEIARYLATNPATCPDCGLQLSGSLQSNCPGCGCRLTLEALRKRRTPVIAVALPTDSRCSRCGYELAGLPSETCPECGSDASAAASVFPADIGRGPAPQRRRRDGGRSILIGIVVSSAFGVAAVMTIGVLVDEMEGALMLAGLVVAAGAVFAVALCGLSR